MLNADHKIYVNARAVHNMKLDIFMGLHWQYIKPKLFQSEIK